jgi:hypothetical protein
VSSRLREGFAVRDVSLNGDEVSLVLAYRWKPYVTVEYIVEAPWPEFGSSVAYELFVEGSYPTNK